MFVYELYKNKNRSSGRIILVQENDLRKLMNRNKHSFRSSHQRYSMKKVFLEIS